MAFFTELVVEWVFMTTPHHVESVERLLWHGSSKTFSMLMLTTLNFMQQHEKIENTNRQLCNQDPWGTLD